MFTVQYGWTVSPLEFPKGGNAMNTFLEELSILLNKYSRENNSDTPDFILAEYLLSCLAAFDAAVSRRTAWYGKEEGR